jgi:hypothetical protein
MGSKIKLKNTFAYYHDLELGFSNLHLMGNYFPFDLSVKLGILEAHMPPIIAGEISP